MPELSKIYCQKCGKLLLEALGEGVKICPKCKARNHYVVLSHGTFFLDDYAIADAEITRMELLNPSKAIIKNIKAD